MVLEQGQIKAYGTAAELMHIDKMVVIDHHLNSNQKFSSYSY